MKKFEIINGRWIKKLDFKNNKDEQVSIKISAVSCFHCAKLDEDYSISLGSFGIYITADGGSSLTFYYMKAEEQQYKNDVAFFEKLLFSY